MLTPGVRALARRWGALDRPEPGRKLHAAPVARPGGVAVVAAFYAALLLGRPAALAGGFPELLLAGAAVGVLGLYDDLRWAGAPLKLTVQVAAAAFAVQAGWRVEALLLPFLGVVPLGALAAPLSVLWLVACSNALNLVDGLDGLAAGLAAIAAVALGSAAALNGDAATCALLAALAGAAAGFLPWNRSPASVFLGDTGALFLGFMLGAASLRAASPAPGVVAAAIPLLTLAVPLGDTAFALVRRLAARRHPLKGDLGHLHHRLLQAGLDQPQATRRLHLAAATLAALGVGLAATVTRVPP